MRRERRKTNWLFLRDIEKWRKGFCTLSGMASLRFKKRVSMRRGSTVIDENAAKRGVNQDELVIKDYSQFSIIM